MEYSPVYEPQKSSLPWKWILGTFFISAALTSGAWYFILNDGGIISPLGKSLGKLIKIDRPLEKYSFKNLSETNIQPSTISIEEAIKDDTSYTSYLFSIFVEGQKVTGQANIPKGSPPPNGFPVILMNRGFIEPSIYQTGMGTKNVAASFASNGFVTIAPDFLGFGGSDKEDVDSMAARVKKVMTPLTILASIESLNQITTINSQKVGMWGHSNGGQISLSILEIIGKSEQWSKPIPTVLWAPVTAAFPYSILYYTDDFDEVGKSLRQVLYNFELTYDTNDYSIHSYLDWIDSPIQIHQGTADELIPLSWSNRAVDTLKEKNKDITYFKYDGADHNLQPYWSEAVTRDVRFFKEYFEL